MQAEKRNMGSLAYLALGADAAVAGLVPWIVTGLRLPLQNLWATETLPAHMPIVLLPFSQYYLAFIVAIVLVGATVGGIIGRATTPRNRGRGLLALIAGVVGVQVIALAQTAVVVSGGLEHSAAANNYLLAIVGGTVAAILLGVGMLALVARAPRAGALIALSIAAIAFGSWLSGLAFPIGTFASGFYTDLMQGVVRVSPAILIGVAIGWCGVETVGRAISAVVSLGILWVGPVVVTAFTSAAGSRILLPYPAEMLDYGLQVFRSAIGMPDLWASSLALALGVAVTALVARRTARMRAAPLEPPPVAPRHAAHRHAG